MDDHFPAHRFAGSSTLRSLGLLWSVVSLGSLPLGCSAEELNPVPVEGASSSSGGGGVPNPPAYTRQVTRRSPFGGRVGNLMVDGDFEHSIVREGSSAQLGWLAINGVGMQTYLRGETGGLCRTGLRCAILPSGHSFWGKGTSAEGTGMIAEVWAKPPAQSLCSVVSPAMFYCNVQGGAQISLPPSSEEPDGDGWCQYRAALAAPSSRLCMWIDGLLPTGKFALVDAATLLPDDGTAPVRAPGPMPPERRQRIAATARWVRDRLPFGQPRPLEPKLGPR